MSASKSGGRVASVFILVTLFPEFRLRKELVVKKIIDSAIAMVVAFSAQAGDDLPKL
jgi:hypothetical protein